MDVGISGTGALLIAIADTGGDGNEVAASTTSAGATASGAAVAAAAAAAAAAVRFKSGRGC